MQADEFQIPNHRQYLAVRRNFKKLENEKNCSNNKNEKYIKLKSGLAETGSIITTK